MLPPTLTGGIEAIDRVIHGHRDHRVQPPRVRRPDVLGGHRPEREGHPACDPIARQGRPRQQKTAGQPQRQTQRLTERPAGARVTLDAVTTGTISGGPLGAEQSPAADDLASPFRLRCAHDLFLSFRSSGQVVRAADSPLA
jgi:hypothetical protein